MLQGTTHNSSRCQRVKPQNLFSEVDCQAVRPDPVSESFPLLELFQRSPVNIFPRASQGLVSFTEYRSYR